MEPGVEPEAVTAVNGVEHNPFATGVAPVATPARHLNRKQRRRADDAHRVGMALNVLTHYGVHVLHDRSVPGSDGVIEHVVIANNGLTVVRSARMMGRIRSTKSELFIGGANATVLVNGLRSRVNTVRHLVGGVSSAQRHHGRGPRRRDVLKFHGAIALGSPQALVDYLEQLHVDAPEGPDLRVLAEELSGIFIPTTLLS